MEETAGHPPAAPREDLPERVVTLNMLAGFNMARWRRAAGMTQTELGEELGGWTKNAVSAAENSWAGDRIRQFDADLIATLAAVYRVPIPALFLPPPDDGDKVRYLIDGDEPVPMDEYFQFLSIEPDLDPDANGPAAAEYRRAVIEAVAKYADGDDRRDVAEAVAEMADTAQLERVLAEARETADKLAALYRLIDDLQSQNAMLQQALERALRRRQ